MEKKPDSLAQLIADINREFAPRAVHAQTQRRSTPELEIRLGHINLATYRASLELLTAPTTRELSMSIVTIDRSLGGAPRPLVMRKTYANPTDPRGSAPVIMHKDKIASYNGLLNIGDSRCPYKVALSRESTIDDGPTPKPEDKVRLRIRTSKHVNISDHEWSVDLTLVRETTLGELAANRAIRRDFFEREEGATHYEVEIELAQSSMSSISAADIEEVVRAACEIAHPRGVEVGTARTPRDLALHFIAHKLRAAHATSSRDRSQSSTPAPPTLKALLNNAVSMTRSEYLSQVFPTIAEYLVTDKADGVRGVAIVTIEGTIAIVTDETMYTSPPDSAIASEGSIIAMYDGEVIRSPPDHVTFYAFDCLMIGGDAVTDEPFESRIALVQPRETPAITIEVKEFLPVEDGNIRKVAETIAAWKRPYKTDGMILTQAGHNYRETRNWKWKSYEDTTIDFLCLQCPERMYGSGQFTLPREAAQSDVGSARRSDFRIYILMCTCDMRQRASLCIQPLAIHNDLIAEVRMRESLIHFVCQFEPLAYVLIVRASDMKPFGGDLHGKVIEMRWRLQPDAESWRKWDLIRAREDRKVGNNIAVANNVFANYIDPFPLDALWKPAQGYFEKESSDALVASNKFRRFIITVILYHKLKDSRDLTILDLGGGRAQDYTRYAAAGARLVVTYDIDSMAIAEGVMRVEANSRDITKSAPFAWIARVDQTAARIRADRAIPGCSAPAYVGRVADITKLTSDTFKADLTSIGIAQRSFGAVVSTFAFHYFCKSRETVESVFRLIDLALAPAGLVIITTMNGARVHDKLRTSGGAWALMEPTAEHAAPKYRISASYKRDESLLDFGQMIKVSVPFSDKMYDEPLCNFEALAQVADALGFARVETISHETAYLTLFEVADAKLAHAVTAADREYTALFDTIVFRRKTAPRAPRSAPAGARIPRAKK
ncbi:MAG: hypothetical protein WC107_07585 [Patescibacteria group bacterium]